MRITTPWLAAVSCLAVLGGCHRPAASNTVATASIPGPVAGQMAPGLWVESVSDHTSLGVTRICLDEAAAGQLATLGRQLSDRCQRHDIAQDAHGDWRFATRCDMGAWGKVATEGVAQGDFQHHYLVQARAQTSGASGGANGPRRVLADVQWKGACPGDMKPGDIVFPDGRRSRLADLAAPS